MYKQDVIDAMAKRANLSKAQAEKALNAFTSVVQDALYDGDKVALIGFGTFETRTRAARIGTNPQTKERITIAARKAPAFKPGKLLKEAVEKS